MRSFSFQRKLRFGDCDPSGIAYFPSYLNILHGVVEEFWTTIGFPLEGLLFARRMGTPTVHLDCNFVHPSMFGDLLTFTLTVCRVGRTSLVFEHTVAGADGPRWKALQTLVATSLEDHRALPWPDEIRQVLIRYSREPVEQEGRLAHG
jgi:4-hydroxybenzoyl-CoA thioesterase